MATPQFNVRVPERYHALLRLIAKRLQANPDGADVLADALSAVCRQPAGGGADSLPSTADSARLDAVEARLASLEPPIRERLDKAEEVLRRLMAVAENIDERVKALEAGAAIPPDPAGPAASRPTARPRHTSAGQGAGGGRRPTTEQDRRIAEMMMAGRSYSEIGAAIGVSSGALARVKERLERQGLLTADDQRSDQAEPGPADL